MHQKYRKKAESQAFRLTILVMAGLAILTLAASAGSGGAFASDAPKKDEHGSSAGDKAGASAEKDAGKKGAAKKGGKQEEKPAETKSKMELTDGYVHEWIPFPAFGAIALPGGDKFAYKPARGEMTVVFMVATWCAPCVKMMPEILRMQARTARLPVRYINVFTHDTKQDATGFMKEHGMKSGVLATHEVLATFKNPELPAIYVGDRNSFMLMRYLKASPADLAEVEESVKYMTAI
jgi:thiol-disulfide isomerase/thioredoxin